MSPLAICSTQADVLACVSGRYAFHIGEGNQWKGWGGILSERRKGMISNIDCGIIIRHRMSCESHGIGMNDLVKGYSRRDEQR